MARRCSFAWVTAAVSHQLPDHDSEAALYLYGERHAARFAFKQIGAYYRERTCPVQFDWPAFSTGFSGSLPDLAEVAEDAVQLVEGSE